jgi:hypothetical protein
MAIQMHARFCLAGIDIDASNCSDHDGQQLGLRPYLHRQRVRVRCKESIAGFANYAGSQSATSPTEAVCGRGSCAVSLTKGKGKALFRKAEGLLHKSSFMINQWVVSCRCHFEQN